LSCDVAAHDVVDGVVQLRCDEGFVVDLLDV
jgi:hypothetical protein